jgi:hypothetical protein
VKGTNTPLPGATVVFENVNERYEITTDADGRYRFEGVGARTARLQVSDNRYMATAQSVDTLLPGQAASLADILVDGGSPLSGEVVNGLSQTPLAGAEVTLVDRFTSQVVSYGLTDAAGHFAFFSLNPLRQYMISVSGPGFRLDSFAGPSSPPLTLTVVPTWTLGMQMRNEAGAPVSAKALLKRQDGLPFAGNQTSVVAWANQQGLVAFGGLSQSLAYRVVIIQPGFATMDIGPLTAAFNEDQILPVTLPTARTLSGVVVDSGGNPVGGVTVRAQRVDSFPAPPLFAMADASGSFSFDSLAPGEISLVTFKAGYDNTRVVLQVPENGGDQLVTLEIELLNGGLSVPN